MNKDTLTWLGCSSLTLILSTQVATASTVKPQDAGIGTSTIDVQNTSISLGQETAQSPLLNSNDKVKQLALSTLGCGCINCQNVVRQMLQQGILTLPQ